MRHLLHLSFSLVGQLGQMQGVQDLMASTSLQTSQNVRKVRITLHLPVSRVDASNLAGSCVFSLVFKYHGWLYMFDKDLRRHPTGYGSGLKLVIHPEATVQAAEPPAVKTSHCIINELH